MPKHKGGVGANILYNMSKGGSTKPSAQNVNPNDEMYDFAINLAGDNPNIHEIITRKMNERAVGISWAGEPLWNKTPEEQNAALMQSHFDSATNDMKIADDFTSRLPETVMPQEAPVTNLQDLNMTADKPLPEINYFGTKIKATGWDKYNNPIFITTAKGTGVLFEAADYFVNEIYKATYRAQERYSQNALESEAVARAKVEANTTVTGTKEAQAAGMAAQFGATQNPGQTATIQATAQTAVDAVNEEAIKKQLDSDMGLKAVTYLKATVDNVLDFLGTAINATVGQSGVIAERGIGTSNIMYKSHVMDDPFAKEKTLKDITLDEAWQSSRVTYSTIGIAKNLTNEYVRRYRAGEDSTTIAKDLENPIKEMLGQIVVDPLNVVDYITGVTKIARMLGKTNTLVATGEVINIINDGQNVLDGIKASKAIDEVQNLEDLNKVTQLAVDSPETLKLSKLLETNKATVGDVEKIRQDANAAYNAQKTVVADLKTTGATEAALKAEEDKLALLLKEQRKANVTARKQTGHITDLEKQLNQAKSIDQVNAQSKVKAVKDANKLKGQERVNSYVTAMAEQANRVTDQIKQIDAGMIGVASSLKLSERTAPAKIADVLDDVRDTVTLISGPHADAEDFGKVITSMIVLASDNVDDVAKARAMSLVLSSPAVESILSPAGMKTSVVFREMMTRGGKVDFGGIIKIAQQAQKEKDPVLFLTQNLDGKLSNMLEKLYPSMTKRIENADKITQLLAEGKPVPSAMKRFMVDGKAEEIPQWIKNTVKANETAQAGVKVGGLQLPGARNINSLFGKVLISWNPQVASRNLIQNAFTTFADGMNPFTALRKGWVDNVFNKIGTPSGALLGLGGMAEESGKGMNLMAKGELVQGRAVSAQALNHAWKQQLGVMFKDLFIKDGSLIQSGFTPQELNKFKSLVESTGDVGKALEDMYSLNASRTLDDFVDAADIKALDGYSLTAETEKAIHSDTLAQAEKKVHKAFEDVRGHANDVYGEEFIPSEEFLKENKDWSEMTQAAHDDLFSFSDLDLIGKKVTVYNDTHQKLTESTFNWYRDAVKKVNQMVGANPNNAELKGLSGTLDNIYDSSIKSINQSRSKATLQKEVLAGQTKAAAEIARKEGNTDLAASLWQDYYTQREKIYVTAREEQFKLWEGMTQQFEGAAGKIVPKYDPTQMNDLFDLNRKWDKVSPADYALQGIAVSGGEKLVPPMTSIPTMARNISEATGEINKLEERLIKGLREKFGNVPTGELTPEKLKALNEVLPVIRQRITTAKAKAFDVSNEMRKFCLLDYRDKTGIDTSLAYLYPYQYWYSRSYKNWMKRLVEKPGMATAYMKLRSGLEKINADMPEWYKYQINIGSLLGLPDDNPIIFNLDATLNPMYGIVGPDFEDRRRRKDFFPAMIDTVGKFGPSVWSPLSYAIAAGYALGGDFDTAEAWVGRSVPVTKLFRDLTGMVGIRGGNTGNPVMDRIFTPGGIETDPMIQAMGGIDPWEQKKIGRALGEMIQAGYITQEQADEAAMKQSGEVWNAAWSYMQNNPDVPIYKRRSFLNATASLGGVGMKGRTKADVLTDQAFTEYNMLYTTYDNYSPVDYKKKMTGLFEKYPFLEQVLLSRKSDTRRESAYAYSVMDRIPPGQINDISYAAGLDGSLMDKFYEDKGRIDRWAKSDKDRFMAFITDLGAVAALPSTTTQHDWNIAKVRSMELNASIETQFGAGTLDLISMYYDLGAAKDDKAQQNLLDSYPQVVDAMNYKAQTILADPVLNEYYGGIEKLKYTLEYQKRQKAIEVFGPNVFDLLAVRQKVVDNKGDVAAFDGDNPVVSEYFDWNDKQKNTINQYISDWGSKHLPSTPELNIRPDAKQESIGMVAIAKAMRDAQPTTSQETDAAAAKYNTQISETSQSGDFSVSKAIDEEAEKRWNGVKLRFQEYQRLAFSNPAAAQQMWLADPTISEYERFSNGMLAQISEAKKGNFPQGDMRQIVQDSMPPELYRLAGDIVKGADESPTVRKRLTRIATQLGITYNQLMMYIL